MVGLFSHLLRSIIFLACAWQRGLLWNLALSSNPAPSVIVSRCVSSIAVWTLSFSVSIRYYQRCTLRVRDYSPRDYYDPLLTGTPSLCAACLDWSHPVMLINRMSLTWKTAIACEQQAIVGSTMRLMYISLANSEKSRPLHLTIHNFWSIIQCWIDRHAGDV